MGSISVRRIDDETLERLRERARRHGVSMEEEVRRTLEMAVASPDRLGDLAVSTFGPAHGVELDLPQHGPGEPLDLDR
ncbi:MAG: FitA-like ribbon-helix-helix domain-containing protein [Phycisphaerae bacterium]